MNTNSNFKNDLTFSQSGETILAEEFSKNGYTVSSTQDLGKFSGYDLIVEKDNVKHKIEFKHDKMADITGNVCFELSKTINNKNEPSGLSVTEADVYVYKIGLNDNNFYRIPTKGLKKWIQKNIDSFRLVSGGDGNRSELVLVPIERFKKVSKILFSN